MLCKCISNSCFQPGLHPVSLQTKGEAKASPFFLVRMTGLGHIMERFPSSRKPATVHRTVPLKRVRVLAPIVNKKREASTSLFLLVRIVGLEPTRRWHRNLNPTRLPIPSYPHILLNSFYRKMTEPKSNGSSCCGARHLRRRQSAFLICRPLPLALLASPATGGARIAPQFHHIRILFCPRSVVFYHGKIGLSTKKEAVGSVISRRIFGNCTNLPIFNPLRLDI